MPKIYDIRDHQIIDVDEGTMRSVISAALGGELTLGGTGRIHLDQHPDWKLTDSGVVFSAAFAGRRFASVEAVATHVIDCQMEQLELARMERDALVEALSRCAAKMHAADIREGLEPSDELEHAWEALAAAGITVKE